MTKMSHPMKTLSRWEREREGEGKKVVPSAKAALLCSEPSSCSLGSEIHPAQNDRNTQSVWNWQQMRAGGFRSWELNIFSEQPFLTNHDENIEAPSRLLLVHAAQEVVADDVDQAWLQTVFGLHHHVDAVSAEGGQPASEGLQAHANTHSNTAPFCLSFHRTAGWSRRFGNLSGAAQ